jgi:hypothetical protein
MDLMDLMDFANGLDPFALLTGDCPRSIIIQNRRAIFRVYETAPDEAIFLLNQIYPQ